MSFPSRVVGFLAFIQILCIIVGFFVTRAALHAVEPFGMVFPTWLQHVRIYGFWYLLVPMVWGILAIGQAQANGGEASISGRQLVVGVVVTIAIVLFFAASAIASLCLAFGGQGLRS